MTLPQKLKAALNAAIECVNATERLRITYLGPAGRTMILNDSAEFDRSTEAALDDIQTHYSRLAACLKDTRVLSAIRTSVLTTSNAPHFYQLGGGWGPELNSAHELAAYWADMHLRPRKLNYDGIDSPSWAQQNAIIKTCGRKYKALCEVPSTVATNLRSAIHRESTSAEMLSSPAIGLMPITSGNNGPTRIAYPARWYVKNTDVTADNLRDAKRTGKLSSIPGNGKHPNYIFDDVCKLWPHLVSKFLSKTSTP